MVYVANALNNTADENFIVSTTVAGVDRRLTINSSAAGDPYVFFTINGTGSSSFGIDNSDSSAWKFTTGTGPSAGSVVFKIATTGAVTFNNVFTFPVADGSAGQTLKTIGSGVVSWQGVGSGTWLDVSTNIPLVANTNYFAVAGCVLSLPTTPSQGDTITVCTNATPITIQAVGAQIIALTNFTSSPAGTAINSNAGDSITLVYRSTGTTWFVPQFVGAWTLS